MSDATVEHPTTGWHPDPMGDPILRWWDGEQWTSGVRELPESPDEVVAPPSRRELHARLSRAPRSGARRPKGDE